MKRDLPSRQNHITCKCGAMMHRFIMSLIDELKKEIDNRTTEHLCVAVSDSFLEHLSATGSQKMLL